MALRELNLGTSANSGDGDNLRAAATKIKENFAEIYADDYVTSARIADDVALGGNPTTTTQSAGDNSTKIATTAYADNAVATAIDAAPAALDTLNELAASLGDDANFAATMTTSLAGKLSTDAGAVGTANISDDAVTIAKIADAAIVTEAEGITSNDNDTTLPTSAAVKDYVDGAVPTYTDFYVTGYLGRDANDYITWTDDTQMDFYVNGSNEMRLESDGDLHVDGDVIAASTTVASDERLKKDIKPIADALEIVNAIKGVDFTWKKGGKKSSGVIAQDIQSVMPHLVKEVKELDSNDSHLAVNYDGLIGVLIEAVKELKAEVETLKTK